MIPSRVYTFCTACVALAALSTPTATATADDARETELLAVLESDAPAAEKALTCKRLSIYGGERSVPALAALLPDPQLASWARIALEAIPGPAVDQALRKAMEQLDGRLLVGVINSIGVRRNTEAVDGLAGQLQDSDLEVASAAAVALGRVGGARAIRELEQSLPKVNELVRSAVSQAIMLSAERLLAEGNDSEAVRLYDRVRTLDVPVQRILEATRGAILARRENGLPLLAELLESDDMRLFALGLRMTYEIPDSEVTEALIERLGNATSDRQVRLIHTLANRDDPSVVPLVLQSASAGPKNVRVAALQVLPRVGDASCVPKLLEVAKDPDSQLSELARAARTWTMKSRHALTELRERSGKS